MKELLFAITLSLFVLASPARAEMSDEQIELEKARNTIKVLVTDDVVRSSQPLNNNIDYIAGNYSEDELKSLIRNYEKITRKVAIKQGKEYVPYDRRIDVKNPEEVKRYLKRRSDIIF